MAIWLLFALSVSRMSSLGRDEVMLLECRSCAGMISMLSWLYQYGVELHLLWCCDLQECLAEGLLLGLWWDCLFLLGNGSVIGAPLKVHLGSCSAVIMLCCPGEIRLCCCYLLSVVSRDFYRGQCSGSGHHIYRIPCHRLGSCSMGGSSHIRDTCSGWLGCLGEWRLLMKILLWVRWGQPIHSPWPCGTVCRRTQAVCSGKGGLGRWAAADPVAGSSHRLCGAFQLTIQAWISHDSTPIPS